MNTNNNAVLMLKAQSLYVIILSDFKELNKITSATLDEWWEKKKHFTRLDHIIERMKVPYWIDLHS